MFELTGNSTIPTQQDEVSDRARGITLTRERDYPQIMYVLRMNGRRTEIDVDSSQSKGVDGVVTRYRLGNVHYGDDREVWRPTPAEVEEIKDAVSEGLVALRRLRNPENPALVVEFWPNRDAWGAPR